MSSSLERPHGRAADALRTLALEIGHLKFAEGSALMTLGDTRVLVAASVERRTPRFVDERKEGWVTAEYAMLPRATPTRSVREVKRGRQSGRSAEIQRLIGRSLRAVIDRTALPGLTVTVDCDILQADGGTRTASITAAYVALVEAFGDLFVTREIERWPFTSAVAAVSVGIVDGSPVLDLEYVEDRDAAVDMNVVATPGGRIVELQGTGEERTFERQELDHLVDLALAGIRELHREQQRATAEIRDAVDEVGSRGKERASPRDEASLWETPG